VGEIGCPYHPRGGLRDTRSWVYSRPAGLLDARRVKMIGMPNRSRPGVTQTMSAIERTRNKSTP